MTILEKSQAILTEKTNKIIPGNLKSGVTAFGVTGTFTSDADATASDLANGKTAYVNGVMITGVVPVYESGDEYGHNLPSGSTNAIYYDDIANRVIITDTPTSVIMINGGDISISLFDSDVATAIGLTADKIKAGVTILGVTGTYGGNS